MAWPAIIAGVATLASAYMASRASDKASKAQIKGADAATQAQLDMYYQGREDVAPWREGGEWALGELRGRMEAGPGEYTESPGYEFRLGEGIRARERGAAARGNVLSGAQTKALTRYGQDYATADVDNYLRRYYDSLKPYQSMAGVGQTTASQGAQLGAQVGQSVGQNYLAAGRARASGYINQANVLSGAVTSGAENYLLWNYLNRGNTAGGGSVPTIRGGQGGGYGF